ncbi:RNA-binding domain-containing protein [Shewanella glacialipiscicola]|uniref:RNA-binding domain-containing protein n=1 Tax=Shewanella glacialipiscicola TaxID=614069 RepID=UPI003D7A0710
MTDITHTRIHTQEIDIATLQESVEVECKLAGGRDGQGAVPNDMWESYSAFANTRGGLILLGVKEKKGHFSVEGIKNPAPLIKNIWDIVNNPQKVSVNLLSEADVRIETLDGQSIIAIQVPRAPRESRPVFINGNPLSGTYLRRYEADQKCLPHAINQMLAEQEDVRDNRILEHYTLDDIDSESLRIYRQMFVDAKPDHVFLTQSDQVFLESIRAWRKDRATGKQGLTLAGLVMFGTWNAIQDVLPTYALDYREQDGHAERWIDRIYTDGSWSGNAFDFYRKVYRKLTADLKVPFSLVGDQRVDRTPAHEAIREALVNTIAHSDYGVDGNILIEKHRDFIGFRNQGLMRVPVQEAITGGNSQCRNPAIHQMFLNIGLSEKAGSGVPNIYRNCRRQDWQLPHLYENDVLGQTILELRMVNIVSEELHQKLANVFGEGYNTLSELKRSILITAITESWFNHDRICALTSEHTREVTLALSQLVSSGYLESSGKHKGKIYHLKGIEVPTPDNDAGKSITFVSSPNTTQLSLFEHESPDHKLESPDLIAQGPDLMAISPDLSRDSVFTEEDQQRWIELKKIAKPIATASGRKVKAEVEQVIIALCDKVAPHRLKLANIAELLDMKSDTLRKNYLSQMVKEQRLFLAYPTIANHPEQGYTTQKDA